MQQLSLPQVSGVSSYCCLKIPSIISGSRGECYAAQIEHEKGEDESEAEAGAELKRDNDLEGDRPAERNPGLLPTRARDQRLECATLLLQLELEGMPRKVELKSRTV